MLLFIACAALVQDPGAQSGYDQGFFVRDKNKKLVLEGLLQVDAAIFERGKGVWADGWWTVEFERKLDTGNKDDTLFDVKREYKFAVGTHDRTGEMDKSSGVIVLHFE